MNSEDDNTMLPEHDNTNQDTSDQRNQEDNDTDQLAFEIRGLMEMNVTPPEIANSAPISGTLPRVNNPSVLVTPPGINIAPETTTTNNVITPF